MGLMDYADMKRLLKGRVGRPETDELFSIDATDDVYDDCLTQAQTRINQLLGIHVPDAIWPVAELLTSSDGGLTYGFGDDADGDAIFAFGHFQLFANREQIPDNPLIEGVDFWVSGTVLRMPNNSPRVFSDGPYALFASPSNVVDSTHEPVVPKIARLCMLDEATIRAFKHAGMDTTEAKEDFDDSWIELLGVIQTQSWAKGGQPLQKRPRSFGLSRYRRH